MAALTLTEADNGRIVEMVVGDEFLVRLPESAATGFRWAVVKQADERFALQETSYSPTPGAGIGGGGETILRFQAKGAGTTQLELKLCRAWEGDASVAGRFGLTIHVRKG